MENFKTKSGHSHFINYYKTKRRLYLEIRHIIPNKKAPKFLFTPFKLQVFTPDLLVTLVDRESVLVGGF